MKHKILFAFAMSVSTLVVYAAVGTNQWTGAVNDWDWMAEENFKHGVPQAEEVVEIPAGKTAMVTNLNSVAVVSSLSQIRLLAEDGKDDGRIVFDSDDDIVISCAFGEMTQGLSPGTLVKRGRGTLTLSSQSRFACMPSIYVESGALKLPSYDGGWSYYGGVDIAAEATLYTAEGAGTFLYGLTGSGLVTNTLESGYLGLELGYSEFERNFHGSIRGNIYFTTKARTMLYGIDNHFDQPFTVVSTSTGEVDFEKLAARLYGVIGVRKFGGAGETGTTGSQNVRSLNNGGGFLYLGTGETTDRKFTIHFPKTGRSFLDGGAHGGLRWEGDISISSSDRSRDGMTVFGFLGSNTVNACVFAGALNSQTLGITNYCLFVEKAGSGIWRFADSSDNISKRTFWTSMAVKNGTLQFDSMEEAGVPCALGLATNLTASYVGLRDDAAHPGPYAYWLGSPGKTVTFEFTGTNGAYATRRPIALSGDAKLKNDTPHPWRFSGISPVASGAKILNLSGSGIGENEVAGIVETSDSAISIVKDGVGTWTLNGSNSFSGKVSVNEGTLRIRRDPGDYTWYRWTIRNKNSETASDLYLPEFSLSDANGDRVNLQLAFTNNWHGILPGQISLPRIGAYRFSSNRGITNLVDGKTDVVNIAYYKHGVFDKNGKPVLECPVENDPSTHIPVVMRLAEDSKPVKYYDVCIHSSTQGKNNPNSWLLEGSADGIHWDELDEQTGLGMPDNTLWWTFAGYQYYVSNTKVQTESKTNGKEIASRPNVTISPNFSNTVSVAAGATLKAIGEVVLSSMEIDASDFGTIDGFSFAASGELNVKNLPEDGSLGGTFVNVKGLANLKDWTFTVDGAAVPGRKLAISSNGSLSVIPRGFTLTIR